METKDRILDAAERLFAERGFDGASLRAITAGAGVNLAAVNYHFLSKEALIQAVLSRKLRPINQLRLAMLDLFEAEAGAKPVPLENIVRAMVEPMVRAAVEAGHHTMNFGKIMGRVYLEQSDQLRKLLVSELREAIGRFIAALRRALPELPAEELYWRVFFSMGTVSHMLAAPGMLVQISGGACRPADTDQMIERLIIHLAAGLRAPLPSNLQAKSRRGRRTASHAGRRPQPRGAQELSPQSR